MNTDKFVSRLSDKTGLSLKKCGEVVQSISKFIEQELRSGNTFSIYGVGTVSAVQVKVRIEDRNDGSFMVHPPGIAVRFFPLSDNNITEGLRSFQRTVSHLTENSVTGYKESVKSVKEFQKLIGRSLAKGKKVKIKGTGVFTSGQAKGKDDLMKISFIPSHELATKLNDAFEGLEEKLVFPAPPMILKDGGSSSADSGRLRSSSNDEEPDSFIRRKLSLISKDLIKLNEEINREKPKDGGRGLWG